MLSPALRTAAEAWLADDPDPETRAEVEALLAAAASDADAVHELEDRFRGPLTFGTAGLRGLLGAGPNRMNRAVVRRATAGFGRYLLEHVPNAAERGVCIGFDGRRLSPELAADAASVLVALGLQVYSFDGVVPTPALAFSVLDRGAAGGIMVTASHNPPAYNGYKVYWENGAQIIPPHDAGIAAHIEAVGPVVDIAMTPRDEAEDRWTTLGDDVIERYLAAVRGQLVHPETPRDIVIAYTALHGVGERTTRRAFADAGFTQVHSVTEQSEPDGTFRTVEFPNPEEDGAMDLVLALAEREGADLVIANDPDADRLAVAVRASDGTYGMLNGNEIGCLLAHYLLDEGPDGKRLVLNTVVSSPMLGAIATAHGAAHEQTLTGFKWIANRALALQAEGYRMVLGYEEALGYTVGEVVRDKDGISAAVVMSDAAAWYRSQGRTLLDELDRMARRYGLFVSRQISKVLPGVEGAVQIRSMMDRVRDTLPREVGGRKVVAASDLERSVRTRLGARAEDDVTEPIDLPPANVLLLELEGGDRAMMRPSGTEPKIKFYFDARIEVGPDEEITAARHRGDQALDAIAESLLAFANG